MSGKKQCNLLDQRNPCYTLRLQILAQSFLKSINVLNFRSDLKVCHVGLKTRSLGQMKNTVFTLLAQSGKVFLLWQWWYTFGHSKMRKSVMQFFFSNTIIIKLLWIPVHGPYKSDLCLWTLQTIMFQFYLSLWYRTIMALLVSGEMMKFYQFPTKKTNSYYKFKSFKVHSV